MTKNVTAKNNSDLIAVIGTQHRRPVDFFFAIAAEAFPFHKMIFELLQQQVVYVCAILCKWRPAGRK